MTAAAWLCTPGSGDQVVKAIWLGTPGSGDQAVIAGWVGTPASGNQQFFAALSASIAPNPATASRSTIGTATASATATPSGGIGPFTYAWSQVSGDSMALSGASTASASFAGTVSAAKTELDAVFQCAITDTATGATATAQVSVQLTYTGTGS